jgi:hypothetical protein
MSHTHNYSGLIHFGFLLLALSFLVAGSFQIEEESYLSHEIDLANWGLRDVSEVGFISIGIYHQKTGDEMVIYHVRKNKPAIEHPTKPRSRIPALQEGVFLLDDFQQGNTNRLGGYFNHIIREPSESHVTIGEAPDGRRSLCFTYSQNPPGFSGFWIHLFDFKLPPIDRTYLDASPFRYLTFDIRGEQGGESLSLQVADFAWDKKEDSLKIGNVDRFLPTGKIQPSWQRAWVPLDGFPERVMKTELANLVFLANRGNGRIYIGDVAFATDKDVPMPKPAEKKSYPPSPHRAMWLWNTKDLLGNEGEQKRLVDFCGQNRITEIFLQLPYEVVEKSGQKEIQWDTSQMAVLLSLLHGEGIKAHALDGAPQFALRPMHEHVLATMQTIIDYNERVQPDERFHGIRYDNEPYILPEFAGVQKESIMGQYLELLERSKELAASVNLEFGVDIPFWFDQNNEFFEPIAEINDHPLTRSVLDIVDNIGIMDYRTAAYGADGVVAHALDELRYASEKGKKVYIGLETTVLPDETLLEFGQGIGPSRLHLKKLDGTKILLQWIPEESERVIKHDLVLFQQKKTSVSSGKITFADRSIADLNEIMEKAESEFRQYPSFYGFAIHYYQSYRKLAAKTR